MTSPGSVYTWEFSIIIIWATPSFSLGEKVEEVLLEGFEWECVSKGLKEHSEGVLGEWRGEGEGK